jgi:imidazolonepropionase-like amidohydrolase
MHQCHSIQIIRSSFSKLPARLQPIIISGKLCRNFIPATDRERLPNLSSRMFKTTGLLLLLSVLLCVQAGTAAQDRPLALTHVTVIDATGQAPPSDMTVVITGEHITTIGKTPRVKIPPGAEVVDASGKFLIPGLWDSHIHLTILAGQEVTENVFAPLLVAHGITTVREMGGDWQRIQKLRQQIASGAVIGPRIIAPGPFVDGPQPADVNFLPVGNEAEARAAVRKLKAQGVDFIKVQANLAPETYRAVLDEAKLIGIPVAGHVPEAVSAFEVARAGQRSVEHSSPVLPGDAGIMLACSSKEAELRAELAALKKAATDQQADRQQLRQRQQKLQHDLATTYDAQKCAGLFALFKQNRVAVVPTLIWAKKLLPLDANDLPRDEALRFIPASLSNKWEQRRNQRIKASTADDFALRRLLFEKARDLTSAMRLARVRLLAGTDAADAYTLPGLSLHQELELFVEAGMTPMEALQAATRDAAEFAGKLETLGTIERGKIADLVLLDASPLQTISNTQKIHAVVVGGKLISQAKRQELLAAIEAFVRKN